MSRWEVFPRLRYRRDFGIHYVPRAPRRIDPDQLELNYELVNPAPPSHQERARAQLHAVLERSGLPQREFAVRVLGCADFTLTRYLGGARIPESRAVFLTRLEAVTVHRGKLVIVLEAGGVRTLPPWRRVAPR
jgi:hypothetical protein